MMKLRGRIFLGGYNHLVISGLRIGHPALEK